MMKHAGSEFSSDGLRTLISAETIAERVASLAKEIMRDHGGDNPILVAVLKGSMIFVADLMRKLDMPLEVEFMGISSYGSSQHSSGEVRVTKDLDVSIEGRVVIVVEDIVDTGLTLSYLLKNLESRNPSVLKLVTLLSKPSRPLREVTIDYCGFEIEDRFVVGYGLDHAERYRNLPYVGVLE